MSQPDPPARPGPAGFQFHLAPPDDEPAGQYQALSGLAVAGLAVGCLSAGALLAPLLWVVPLAGAVLSAAALYRIARPELGLVGRKIALGGLALSLTFGVAGASNWFFYRLALQRGGRAFAADWFAALAANRPEDARLLTLYAAMRPAARVQTDNADGPVTKTYAQRPEVRKLLELGPAAAVRYAGADWHLADRDRDTVLQSCAVTWTDALGLPQRTTITLQMERIRDPAAGKSFWRLMDSKEVPGT